MRRQALARLLVDARRQMNHTERARACRPAVSRPTKPAEINFPCFQSASAFWRCCRLLCLYCWPLLWSTARTGHNGAAPISTASATKPACRPPGARPKTSSGAWPCPGPPDRPRSSGTITSTSLRPKATTWCFWPLRPTASSSGSEPWPATTRPCAATKATMPRHRPRPMANTFGPWWAPATSPATRPRVARCGSSTCRTATASSTSSSA